jgi:hypothetical protein
MPGSQTTPGQRSTRSSALRRVAFRTSNYVGTRDKCSIVAQWLAYTHPCQRFTVCLTTHGA